MKLNHNIQICRVSLKSTRNTQYVNLVLDFLKSKGESRNIDDINPTELNTPG